ncbi:hypothetical protein HDV06_004655 [Boothiomyces sp. JEL0866]|nr:hypothetical protein HDV06_004655 [Boothiomyces sp. JEL0866]
MDQFPPELYNPDGSFTPPVKELLDFAPQILESIVQAKILEPKETKSNTNSGVNEALLNSALLSSITKRDNIQIINNNNPTMQNTQNIQSERSPSKKENKKEEVKEHTEKKEEEKEESTNYLLGLGAFAAMLFAFYNVAQKTGEIDYLENVDMIVDRVVDILKSTKIWMYKCKKYDLKVPKIVEEDCESLKVICDCIERISSRQEKIWKRRCYGVLAISSSCVLGSIFPKTPKSLAYVGAAGICSSLLGLVYIIGLHSSRPHQLSIQLYASRAQELCKTLIPSPVRVQKVRKSLGIDQSNDTEWVMT